MFLFLAGTGVLAVLIGVGVRASMGIEGVLQAMPLWALVIGCYALRFAIRWSLSFVGGLVGLSSLMENRCSARDRSSGVRAWFDESLITLSAPLVPGVLFWMSVLDANQIRWWYAGFLFAGNCFLFSTLIIGAFSWRFGRPNPDDRAVK